MRPLQQQVAADHLGVLQHVEGCRVHGVVGAGKAVIGMPRHAAEIKQVRILDVADDGLLGVIKRRAIHRMQLRVAFVMRVFMNGTTDYANLL